MHTSISHSRYPGILSFSEKTIQEEAHKLICQGWLVAGTGEVISPKRSLFISLYRGGESILLESITEQPPLFVK